MSLLSGLKQVVEKLGKVEIPRDDRGPAPGLAASIQIDSASILVGIGNISISGIYLVTDKQLTIGNIVPLTLRRQNAPDDAELQLSIQVRVIDQQPGGFGLAFVVPPGMKSELWTTLMRNLVQLSDRDEVAEAFRILCAIQFVCSLCQSEADEAVQLFLGGHLDSDRTATLVKVVRAAETLLSAEPEAKRMRAHPKMLAHVLREASWATDEVNIQLWAGLLVSSCTANAPDESNQVFANLLVQLTPSEARIFVRACERAVASRPGTENAASAPDAPVSVTEVATPELKTDAPATEAIMSASESSAPALVPVAAIDAPKLEIPATASETTTPPAAETTLATAESSAPAPEIAAPVPEALTTATEIPAAEPETSTPAPEALVTAPEISAPALVPVAGIDALQPATSATASETTTPAAETALASPESSAPAPEPPAPVPQALTPATEIPAAAPETPTPAPEAIVNAPEISAPALAPDAGIDAPKPETSATALETTTPAAETALTAAESSAPTPEIAFPVPQALTPAPEVPATKPETSSDAPSLLAPQPEGSAPMPESPALAAETAAPVPEAAGSVAEAPVAVPDVSATRPETSATASETTASASEASAPAPEAIMPPSEGSAPAPEVAAPVPEVVASAPEVSTAEAKTSTPAPGAPTPASVSVIFSPKEMIEASGVYDLYRNATDLAYLFNLGLVRKVFDFTSYHDADSFDVTPSVLGLELYKRCLGHRGAVEEQHVESAKAHLANFIPPPQPVAAGGDKLIPLPTYNAE